MVKEIIGRVSQRGEINIEHQKNCSVVINVVRFEILHRFGRLMEDRKFEFVARFVRTYSRVKL